MDPFNAGWLSILPPVIAIVLALCTKEVISSLLIGILSGTFIYAVGMDHANLLMGTVQTTFKLMSTKVDFNILMFCTMLGALVYTISMAGGSRAYGDWAIRRIKSRKASLFASGGLGAFIFIDDYFNCLTVGTVMRPVTDTYGVSRAKLAYIIYALTCIAMVFILCFFQLDFGPMRRAEERAQKGDVGSMDTATDQMRVSEKGTIWDMVVPIGALIVFAVLCLMYSGGYWGDDPAYHSFAASLGNSSASEALVWSSFGALVVAFLMFVPRKVVSFRDFMDGSVEGMKMMLPANIILVLAWTISGVCRDLLQTPLFVESLVTTGGFSAMWLPAAVFALAAFLSFSTGTAWGTFGILIPIIVPVAQALDPNLVVVSLAATLAGSVFGDHCSPISDTTILSSAGAGCSHIEHVATQLPYAWVCAIASFAGYVVAGLTEANAYASLATSFVTLIALMVILHFLGNKRTAQIA